MEESVNVEHVDEHGLTRSELIKRAAVAGVGVLPSAPSPPGLLPRRAREPTPSVGSRPAGASR